MVGLRGYDLRLLRSWRLRIQEAELCGLQTAYNTNPNGL